MMDLLLTEDVGPTTSADLGHHEDFAIVSSFFNQFGSVLGISVCFDTLEGILTYQPVGQKANTALEDTAADIFICLLYKLRLGGGRKTNWETCVGRFCSKQLDLPIDCSNLADFSYFSLSPANRLRILKRMCEGLFDVSAPIQAEVNRRPAAALRLKPCGTTRGGLNFFFQQDLECGIRVYSVNQQDNGDTWNCHARDRSELVTLIDSLATNCGSDSDSEHCASIIDYAAKLDLYRANLLEAPGTEVCDLPSQTPPDLLHQSATVSGESAVQTVTFTPIKDVSSPAKNSRDGGDESMAGAAPPLLTTEVSLCVNCKRDCDEESLLMCDRCDAHWHMLCLTPKLWSVPEEEWYCSACCDIMLVRVLRFALSHLDRTTLEYQAELRKEKELKEKEERRLVQLKEAKEVVELSSGSDHESDRQSTSGVGSDDSWAPSGDDERPVRRKRKTLETPSREQSVTPVSSADSGGSNGPPEPSIMCVLCPERKRFAQSVMKSHVKIAHFEVTGKREVETSSFVEVLASHVWNICKCLTVAVDTFFDLSEEEQYVAENTVIEESDRLTELWAIHGRKLKQAPRFTAVWQCIQGLLNYLCSVDVAAEAETLRGQQSQSKPPVLAAATASSSKKFLAVPAVIQGGGDGSQHVAGYIIHPIPSPVPVNCVVGSPESEALLQPRAPSSGGVPCDPGPSTSVEQPPPVLPRKQQRPLLPAPSGATPFVIDPRTAGATVVAWPTAVSLQQSSHQAVTAHAGGNNSAVFNSSLASAFWNSSSASTAARSQQHYVQQQSSQQQQSQQSLYSPGVSTTQPLPATVGSNAGSQQLGRQNSAQQQHTPPIQQPLPQSYPQQNQRPPPSSGGGTVSPPYTPNGSGVRHSTSQPCMQQSQRDVPPMQQPQSHQPVLPEISDVMFDLEPYNTFDSSQQQQQPSQSVDMQGWHGQRTSASSQHQQYIVDDPSPYQQQQQPPTPSQSLCFRPSNEGHPSSTIEWRQSPAQYADLSNVPAHQQQQYHHQQQQHPQQQQQQSTWQYQTNDVASTSQAYQHPQQQLQGQYPQSPAHHGRQTSTGYMTYQNYGQTTDMQAPAHPQTERQHQSHVAQQQAPPDIQIPNSNGGLSGIGSCGSLVGGDVHVAPPSSDPSEERGTSGDEGSCDDMPILVPEVGSAASTTTEASVSMPPTNPPSQPAVPVFETAQNLLQEQRPASSENPLSPAAAALINCVPGAQLPPTKIVETILAAVDEAGLQNIAKIVSDRLRERSGLNSPIASPVFVVVSPDAVASCSSAIEHPVVISSSAQQVMSPSTSSNPVLTPAPESRRSSSRSGESATTSSGGGKRSSRPPKRISVPVESTPTPVQLMPSPKVPPLKQQPQSAEPPQKKARTKSSSASSSSSHARKPKRKLEDCTAELIASMHSVSSSYRERLKQEQPNLASCLKAVPIANAPKTRDHSLGDLHAKVAGISIRSGTTQNTTQRPNRHAHSSSTGSVFRRKWRSHRGATAVSAKKLFKSKHPPAQGCWIFFRAGASAKQFSPADKVRKAQGKEQADDLVQRIRSAASDFLRDLHRSRRWRGESSTTSTTKQQSKKAVVASSDAGSLNFSTAASSGRLVEVTENTVDKHFSIRINLSQIRSHEGAAGVPSEPRRVATASASSSRKR